MPFQNRVDPFGVVHAVAERGMFTGNRGVIHDPATRTLLRRRWATRAWIICDCGFRSRRRVVMGANGPNGSPGWTNLFFLDEVTALAAGHRPCFYCRRAGATAFRNLYGSAFGVPEPRAGDIDRRLHGERLAVGAAAPVLSHEALRGLPDGVMVSVDGRPHALRAGSLLPWSFAGYGAPRPLAGLQGRHITAITPLTTRAVLAQGYQPVWHPGAGA